MSSLIYHTDGIVIDYVNFGETDRICVVFSKDFGLLRLFAKAIRSSRSKLAPHMPLFSHSRIAFVLGRSFPLLIDAEEIGKFSFANESMDAAGRMSRLMSRIIQGEGEDLFVWGLLLSAFQFLRARRAEANNEEAFSRDLVFFELLFGVRLLYHLGYVGDAGADVRSFFENNEWDLPRVQEKQTVLRSIFDRGIRASHL